MVGGGGGWGLCLPWIRVCIRIVPLCVSVEFLSLSVYQSVCLSKYMYLYMYMPVCLHVALSPLSLPLSLSLSVCGVDLADQGSRARYRVIQFFSWDSKSVPFPTNLSWLMPIILIMHHLSVRFHYMRGSRKFCQRGSNLDNVFFSLMGEVLSKYHY